jgi:hypothetical protein
MKNTSLVIGCVVSAVVAGGAGFYGGTLYQKNQRTMSFRNNQLGAGVMRGNVTQNGNRGNVVSQPNGGMRGGAIVGEVTGKDDKSLTIKMADGSSKNIILSGSTTYRIANETKVDEVQVGKTVSVFGTANSDGSTTAMSIELSPMMRQSTTK